MRERERERTCSRRRLQPGLRVLDPQARVVSPTDGRLTFCGRSGASQVEVGQVKGTYYSLESFLGQSEGAGELVRRGGELYQLVIYLPPGSYHRFHSPASWRVSRLAHIWGERLSVAPPVLKHVQVRQTTEWSTPGLQVVKNQLKAPRAFLSFRYGAHGGEKSSLINE